MRGLPASPPFMWLGFLALGAMQLFDGAIMALFGAEAVQGTIQDQLGSSWGDLLASSPAFAQYLNTLITIIGLLLTGFSLFVIIVSLTGYRRHHKWAWYAMWNPTAFYLVLTAILIAKGDIYTSDALSPEFLGFLVIAAASFQVAAYAAFFGNHRLGDANTTHSGGER